MPVEIFCCYAHEDETLLNQLKMHLKPLERQGLIELWYDRAIDAGAVWEDEISQHLNAAQIILLLISPDFMNSEYCYGIELKRALERHKQGTAHVIPVILRHVYWKDVLGQLQALPRDGLPITDLAWHNQDRALYNVAEGLRKIVANLKPPPPAQKKPAGEPQRSASPIQQSASLSPDPELIPQSSTAPRQTVVAVPQASLLKPFPLPNPLRRRWSRRTILLAGVVMIGGVTWLAVSEGKYILPPVFAHPTAIPTPLPQGTTLVIYTDHQHRAVFSAVWSLDGNRIASAGQDGYVLMWDARPGDRPIITDKSLFGYTGHWPAAVYSVAWSPLDGNRLASASADGTVHIWDALPGGRPMHLLTYTGHKAAVWSAAWSHDGKRIASASENGTVHVWDASIGTESTPTIRTTPLLICEGHSAAVYSVAWSHDGKRIASAGQDGTVRVWDANISTESTPITRRNPQIQHGGHNNGVWSVAWSHDDQWLAFASYDGSVQIWDASTGKPYFMYTVHKGKVLSVVWSPTDGKRIASADDGGSVLVWEGL